MPPITTTNQAVTDKGTLNRHKNPDQVGHIDFALMAFCSALGFYAVKVPLSVTAWWLVVIGGITNPCVFVMPHSIPLFGKKPVWKVYFGGQLCCHNNRLWLGLVNLLG